MLSDTSASTLLSYPLNGLGDCRCAYAHVTGYCGGRQPQFFPAALGNGFPCAAYLPALAAPLQFERIYSAPAAFLFNDLLYGFSRPFTLELAQVPVFCFFQDLVDKFASTQNALIEILFLPSPSHGQYLRPPSLAAD